MKRAVTRRYLANLRIERDNAALYAGLAAISDDLRTARAFRRIAEAERANAAFWVAQLAELDVVAPEHRTGVRVRTLLWLASRFGSDFVMPTVARITHADHHATPVDRSSHRDHFQEAGSALPRNRLHSQGGNTLRAAVLGANDGLVSNVSLVMGMAGAAVSDHAVVLAGLAGLVAGACSMALGEWLSVNSSREFYQAQITARAERLAVAPEDVRLRIAAIYRDKGLDEGSAETMAAQLVESPRSALDLLVREDLGVDPEDLGGSAWSAAFSSFILFAVGAAFPVAPYLFLHGHVAMIGSVLSTSAGLAMIASATSLFTGRPVFFSIARQFAITAAAAGVTWLLGNALGAVLG
ncbi:VIT1/CCC1 transporter family protein [Oleiagrimonas sp.]|jgi:VIT1/CCC1 family predicted Fe2+/Mn2+ transporter|uniref:VIT1/CCC1 transporter family protein n=1 Tax=Oleiagrimonas sp. TaxID=2010330 RepID=UPI002607E63B|nr:VIT1/CCC1 transporter family protein [Oleiagrimonas sp.]MDA3914837.1 VIT1/CCC1 transporter family protein [Oleiagrimonas sp.]